MDDPYRHQGVGRALYTSLFSILASQGFCNAYAGITLPNQPSVALHQSLGFQPIGTYSKVGFKLGKWHDVGWWELMLRQRPTEPDSPIDLPSVIRLPQWTSHLELGVALLRIDEPRRAWPRERLAGCGFVARFEKLTLFPCSARLASGTRALDTRWATTGVVSMGNVSWHEAFVFDFTRLL